MSTSLRVVLLDDLLVEPENLVRALEQAGFSVSRRNLPDPGHLAAELEQNPADLVICGDSQSGDAAIRALEALQQRSIDVPILVIGSKASVGLAIKLLKRGAADYLTPGDLQRLGDTAREALAARERRAEQRRARTELENVQERYSLAARAANDGIWDWDLRSDRIYLSPRWKELLGYRDDELSDRPEEWFNRVQPTDLARLKSGLAAHLEGLTPTFEDEHEVLHRDGSQRWLLCRGLAVRDSEGRPTRIAGTATDITSHKRLEQQLLYNAFHDRLTGLPNRALFMDRLQHATDLLCRRAGYSFAVLFLDMDNFKEVNDTHGHAMGDRLLEAVARRVERCLRATDTLARLGGDEFAVLMDDVRIPAHASRVAERIGSALRQPFEIDGVRILTSASIGIALSSDETDRAEEILRQADQAMYRAKMDRSIGA